MDKTLLHNSMPPEILKKNNLLHDLENHKITMAEFNKECAYWFISCKGLEPLPLPTRPPELKEYDRLSLREKANISSNFWRQKEIFNYLNQKRSIEDRNRGMLQTLKEYKEYIPAEDAITKAKYDSFIIMYCVPGEITDLAQDFNGEIVEKRYKD